MLVYVQTSLFDSSAQVLVNTVNTVGAMGKGIALQFKKLYPEMFNEYRKYCETGELTVGKLWLYKSETKWILNFPTKKNWRNKSKLEYIESGLKKFVATYQAHGIESISFPQLGTGNGGLDWEKEVRPLMERYLRPLPIKVYIHLYSKADSTPEFNNIHEMKDWIDRDPANISVSDFKSDLKSTLGSRDRYADGHNITFVDQQNTSDDGSDAYMIVALGNGTQYSLAQSDIADLWTRLRDQGIIGDIDLPQAILKNQDGDFIKTQLAQLPYIKLIDTHLSDKQKKATLSLERSGLPEMDNDSQVLQQDLMEG